MCVVSRLSQCAKLCANWHRSCFLNAPSQPSLTLTCHTDLGESHDTHSTTSQPHGPQSCSNLHGWQRHARPLTFRTQTEKPDSTHGFQGGSQNGPTPPPPPSARGQNFKRPYLGNTSSVSNARHDSTNGTALPNKRHGFILGHFFGHFGPKFACYQITANGSGQCPRDHEKILEIEAKRGG